MHNVTRLGTVLQTFVTPEKTRRVEENGSTIYCELRAESNAVSDAYIVCVCHAESISRPT